MYPDVAGILDCIHRSKSSTLNTLYGLEMQLQVGLWNGVVSNVPRMTEMCVWWRLPLNVINHMWASWWWPLNVSNMCRRWIWSLNVRNNKCVRYKWPLKVSHNKWPPNFIKNMCIRWRWSQMDNNKMCILFHLNNFINQRSSQEAKRCQASSANSTTFILKYSMVQYWFLCCLTWTYYTLFNPIYLY